MVALIGSNKSPSQDDILRTLETIRNDQERARRKRPNNFQTFMPEDRINFEPRDTSQWRQNLQGIDQIGKNATELSLVIAQNKAAKEAQKRARKQKKLARNQLITTANATAAASGPQGSNAPLQPAKGFNINAPLVTRNWRGMTLRMNASVIGRFTSFLDALAATGYKVKSIGTYANRNIAGTGVKSLHSLGLAMDINPGTNPVTWNGQNITDLPPNVGRLAARYGIKWGGAWLGQKRDPMHFSVPYGGRM